MKTKKLFKEIIKWKVGKLLFIFFISIFILSGCGGGSSTPATSTSSGQTVTTSNYIDVHSHLHGKLSATQTDFEGAADVAIVAMDKWGIKKMIIMPPPFTNQTSQSNAKYEIDAMSGVLTKYPDRFVFIGGGGTLNVMIQKAVSGETVTVDEFKTEARRIASITGFVGFGEMAAEHFCLGEGHVYQTASPDHDLFKALVDVASEKNVPIDIHMEAVPSDMSFPTLVTGGCSANPTTLNANIQKFKNLLDYAKTKNPVVKIIWDHVGWDNTKQRTVALVDELLAQYNNLYMSIKVSPNDSPSDNMVIDSNSNLKTVWLDLFKKYPNQFMLGSDQFFVSPQSTAQFPPSIDQTWQVLSQLSEDVKSKIAYENAKTVFNIQ